jgi:uracil DNA glycosylase
MGTWVDLAALLGFLVLMLNTIMSKWSEIEKSYSRCGPSFSKKRKSLKTLPLEELETILLAWFKQAQTTKASIDGTHLKE